MTPALKKAREEADALRARVQAFEAKERQREAEKKKRWDCTVYCSNCQLVQSVSCPAGWVVATGCCCNCKVCGTLHLVRQ